MSIPLRRLTLVLAFDRFTKTRSLAFSVPWLMLMSFSTSPVADGQGGQTR